MYKPSDLHQHLDSLGAKPKKRLSQNFLVDGNIVRKIVQAAHVKPGDLVLEIGPGPGALTQALLEAGAHVIAVEKDPTLASGLEKLKSPERQLEIFCDDIMTFPLREKLLPLNQKVKVISNLPYHLTTPILKRLIEEADLFSSLTLMVQEEVARRFTAKPKTPEYGSLTLFLSFYTNPRYAFMVSRNCFFPKPKVDSAIVYLEFKTPPLSENVDGFFKITRTAFQHRRKMMRGSLKELCSPETVTASLTNLGLNPCARPEDLSLDDFLRFFAEISK